MTDCVLIENGLAHQVWRGKTKAELPPLHADVLKNIVEVDYLVAEGDVHDGAQFTKPDFDSEAEARRTLAQSDFLMIRAIEDIWDVLKHRVGVNDDDLPSPVRARLVARRAAREALKD